MSIIPHFTTYKIPNFTTYKIHHITIHGIRHSNCTWLLSGNIDPQKIGYVSKRLGHASIKETLDVYMHIHKKEDTIILQELDDLVFNVLKSNTYYKMM